MTPNNKGKLVLLNLFAGISIFFVLIALRLPILLNSDSLLNTDEALMAYEILDLYNGGPFFFYYSVTTYFGVLNGLAAIPFYKLFGVSPLAFKLPATFFYTLYILSTYWLAKKILPQAAKTVILLMIFTSPAVWNLTSLNFGLGLTCFLGNLVFLTFYKAKKTLWLNSLNVFLLGFASGFAIYSFTYTIIYIGSIIVLHFLSLKKWNTLRKNFSIKNIAAWFFKRKESLHRIAGILDAIILFFIPIVLFSYVFGGFGIDIARYSILQSNELHKPLQQLLIIIIIRACLYRQDISGIFSSGKSLILSIDPLIRRSCLFGIIGFILGILPRILSILSGQITRGGQGFDVDFVPTNLAFHIWELIIWFIPETLGLREPITQLFQGRFDILSLSQGLLAGLIIILLGKAAIFFISPRTKEIKNFILLKQVDFNPAQFLFVLPVLLCAAVIASQGPPAVRYLLPLHGVVSIWTAIYLQKVLSESKGLFVFALVAWCLFSAIGIYKSYLTSGIVHNLSIQKRPNPILNVINFCKKNQISHAYSDYSTSILTSFLSKGDVKMAEYTKNIFLEKIKRELAGEEKFAIVVNGNSKDLNIYQRYLNKNMAKFSQDIVQDNNGTNRKFYIFSNFEGDLKTIDSLRSLISN
ncbi:MAG: hypothetical protein VW455_07385 [Nitrospinota bacterium]